jgi:hypothetical protein
MKQIYRKALKQLIQDRDNVNSSIVRFEGLVKRRSEKADDSPSTATKQHAPERAREASGDNGSSPFKTRP